MGIKNKIVSYFDTVDPVAHMEERYGRRHIVHDKDAISFPQILPAYAAIFLLACKIWQQKNGVFQRYGINFLMDMTLLFRSSF